MKKTVSILCAALLLGGLLGFPIVSPQAEALTNGDAGRFATVAATDNLDFTLVNKTGVEIYALYVSPNNSDEWGEDVLGRDTLPSGDSVDIEFSRKEKAKMWDLRIEDSSGEFIEWEKFNLTEISKITLFYKNGKATATVE